MLDLNAFYHLPALDARFEELARLESGLVIVTGMDARPEFEAGAASSGRALVFSILARRMFEARPTTRAAIVSEQKDTVLRLPSRARGRLRVLPVKPEQDAAQQIRAAKGLGYPLLFVEKLTNACAVDAVGYGMGGRLILTQLDSPLYGKWMAQYMQEACGEDASIDNLQAVVAVRRVPALCDACKRQDGETWHADGCPECQFSGQRGEITLFDVWRAVEGYEPASQPSALSFQEYARQVAAEGWIAEQDAAELDTALLYRTFQLLNRAEQRSTQAETTLNAQVGEMEAARRAMESQYRTSIALQEVGQKLLQLDSVQELAAYICRKARDLTGADRAALYLLRGDGTAQIIALNGWDGQWLETRVNFEDLFQGDSAGDAATPHSGYPPGIPTRVADLEGAHIRAGLRVPLIAQRQVLGAMIFHSTVRKQFDARDVALLQALANAGAATIQRADLIDDLRDKVGKLEQAQGEIAKKERLERELELARQVQQNMLPHIFPLVPGLVFYARNEPARQVGGDFYDVILLDADRVGVVIADVSDKGMPAALFMALTRSLVRAEAPRERSPETVLRRVHRLLREVAEPSQFVTIFYGVMDLTARTLTYVRAGHDYPFLLRGDTVTLLQAPGTILGLLDESELILQEETVALAHGDRLALYTDGLTDAIDASQEPFGRQHLMDALLAERNAPLQAMGDAVFDAVQAYQGDGDAFDDETLVIVEVK